MNKQTLFCLFSLLETASFCNTVSSWLMLMKYYRVFQPVAVVNTVWVFSVVSWSYSSRESWSGEVWSMLQCIWSWKFNMYVCCRNRWQVERLKILNSDCQRQRTQPLTFFFFVVSLRVSALIFLTCQSPLKSLVYLPGSCMVCMLVLAFSVPAI